MTVICKDCRHYHHEAVHQPTEVSDIYHLCKNPKLKTQDFVLGGVRGSKAAHQVREDVDLCGPEGQWFEP